MEDPLEPPNWQDTEPALGDLWGPPKLPALRQVLADHWAQPKLQDTKSAQGDLQVALKLYHGLQI